MRFHNLFLVLLVLTIGTSACVIEKTYASMSIEQLKAEKRWRQLNNAALWKLAEAVHTFHKGWYDRAVNNLNQTYWDGRSDSSDIGVMSLSRKSYALNKSDEEIYAQTLRSFHGENDLGAAKQFGDELFIQARKNAMIAYGYAQEHFPKENPNQALSLQLLGNIYFYNAKYAKAEEFYKQAYSAAQLAKDPEIILLHHRIAIDLGRVYSKLGKCSDSISILKKASEILASYAPRELFHYEAKLHLAVALSECQNYTEAENILYSGIKTLWSNFENRYQGSLGDQMHARFKIVLSQILRTQNKVHEADELFYSSDSVANYILSSIVPQWETALPEYIKEYQKFMHFILQSDRASRFVSISNILIKLEPMFYKHLSNIILSFGEGDTLTPSNSREQGLVMNTDYFLNMTTNLAIQINDPEITHFAAEIMLRWHKLRSEAEIKTHRFLLYDSDIERNVAYQKIKKLRSQLSLALHRENLLEKDLKQILHELKMYSDIIKFSLLVGQSIPKQSMSPKIIPSLMPRIDDYQFNLDELEKSISYKSAVLIFKRYVPTPFAKTTDMTSSKYKLKNQTHRWAALLIYAGKQVHWLDIGSDNAVKKQLDMLQTALQKLEINNTDNHAHILAESALAKLYQQLIAPFESQLQSAEKIYIIPDEKLNAIPFSALRKDNGKYLIESKQITILDSIRDLFNSRYDEKDQDLDSKLWLGIGQPDLGWDDKSENSNQTNKAYKQQDLDNHFNTLHPASAEEIKLIQKYAKQQIPQLNTQYRLNQYATEKNVKSLIHDKQPDYIHFSTHGFFLSKAIKEMEKIIPGTLYDEKRKMGNIFPLSFSGLTLAGANTSLMYEMLDKDNEDGILFSTEIAGLNLLFTRLVILSACDTGKGMEDYSEGLYGVTRAFHIAGAKKVLMALWPIDAEQSRDFMLAFYKHWLGNKLSIAQALRATQLDYIHHSDVDLRHPLVWAGYSLSEK